VLAIPIANPHLPQNLASAALSNPHVHVMGRSLSMPNYQSATAMSFVSYAFTSRIADSAPGSQMLYWGAWMRATSAGLRITHLHFSNAMVTVTDCFTTFDFTWPIPGA
jgi:hypothetical protein